MYIEFANKTRSVTDSLDKNSSLFEFVGDDNIAIVNGHQWKEQRKAGNSVSWGDCVARYQPCYQIMNPAFHRATPVGMFGSLMPKVFRLVEEQPTLPALDLMQKLTLDALGKSVFGKCLLSMFKIHRSHFDPT